MVNEQTHSRLMQPVTRITPDPTLTATRLTLSKGHRASSGSTPAPLTFKSNLQSICKGVKKMFFITVKWMSLRRP